MRRKSWTRKTITPWVCFFCYVHQLVAWEWVSEFIFFRIWCYTDTHTHEFDLFRSRCFKWQFEENEQITFMLRVIDRIASNREIRPRIFSCLILLFKTCVVNRHISNFIRSNTIVFLLLHHIKKNLSFVFHPIVNCTHTYQVDWTCSSNRMIYLTFISHVVHFLEIIQITEREKHRSPSREYSMDKRKCRCILF